MPIDWNLVGKISNAISLFKDGSDTLILLDKAIKDHSAQALLDQALQKFNEVKRAEKRLNDDDRNGLQQLRPDFFIQFNTKMRRIIEDIDRLQVEVWDRDSDLAEQYSPSFTSNLKTDIDQALNDLREVHADLLRSTNAARVQLAARQGNPPSVIEEPSHMHSDGNGGFPSAIYGHDNSRATNPNAFIPSTNHMFYNTGVNSYPMQPIDFVRLEDGRYGESASTPTAATFATGH